MATRKIKNSKVNPLKVEDADWRAVERQTMNAQAAAPAEPGETGLRERLEARRRLQRTRVR